MKSHTLKKIHIFYLVLFLYITLVPALTVAGSAKIPTPNFEIVSYRGEWRYDRFYIIGEIKNIGNISGGPKIEAIARDSQGILIASKTFWPNSVQNILPGSSCGIKHHITEDRRAKTIEVKVISVDKW